MTRQASGKLNFAGYPLGTAPPKGWEMSSLGEIAEDIRPGFASGEHNKEGKGIPHLRPMNINSEGRMDLSQVQYVDPETSSLRLRKGDILFNNTNSPVWVGKTALIKEDIEFAFSNHMTRIRVIPQIANSDFVARQLHFLATSGYFQLHCKRHVNQASIASGALEETVPLLLPPYMEQQRIVDKVNEMQMLTKRVRGALEDVPDLLDQLRQSVLAAAFRGGLTRDWRAKNPDVEPASELLKRVRIERRKRWEQAELEKLKAKGLTGEKLDSEFANRRKLYKESRPVDTTDLPELPESWSWTTIGEAFQVQIGATPSRKRPEYWGDEHHWVSSGEVAWNHITTTKEKITAKGLANTSTSLHPPGTVLLGMIGEGKTRGQAAILDIMACNNQNSAAIKVSSTPITSEYIYRYLQYQYEQTRGEAMGNSQPALNKSRVESIVFPLMPLREIETAVEKLEALLTSYDSVSDEVEGTISQLSFLDQSILSKAFRGRLAPQDPNDDPASVLLEGIRKEKAQRTVKRVGRLKATGGIR